MNPQYTNKDSAKINKKLYCTKWTDINDAHLIILKIHKSYLYLGSNGTDRFIEINGNKNHLLLRIVLFRKMPNVTYIIYAIKYSTTYRSTQSQSQVISIDRKELFLETNYIVLLGDQRVLTMTRYDDINEDVKGARRKSGFIGGTLKKRDERTLIWWVCKWMM